MITCCLKLIFSFGVFLARLDKKESGKTKAALPTKISPSSIELTATDVPGLGRTQVKPTGQNGELYILGLVWFSFQNQF